MENFNKLYEALNNGEAIIEEASFLKTLEGFENISQKDITRIHTEGGLKHDEKLEKVEIRKAEVLKKIKTGHIALGLEKDGTWKLVVFREGWKGDGYQVITADETQFMYDKKKLVANLKGKQTWYLSANPYTHRETPEYRQVVKQRGEQASIDLHTRAAGEEEFGKITKKLAKEWLPKVKELMMELMDSDHEYASKDLQSLHKVHAKFKDLLERGLASRFWDRRFYEFIGGFSGYDSIRKNEKKFTALLGTAKGRSEIYVRLKKYFNDRVKTATSYTKLYTGE